MTNLGPGFGDNGTTLTPLEKRLLAASRGPLGLANEIKITEPRPGVHRTTCDVTGQWLEFDTRGWRIRRIADSGLADRAPAPRIEARSAKMRSSFVEDESLMNEVQAPR